jgi:hypothetical protein
MRHLRPLITHWERDGVRFASCALHIKETIDVDCVELINGTIGILNNNITDQPK